MRLFGAAWSRLCERQRRKRQRRGGQAIIKALPITRYFGTVLDRPSHSLSGGGGALISCDAVVPAVGGVCPVIPHHPEPPLRHGDRPERRLSAVEVGQVGVGLSQRAERAARPVVADLGPVLARRSIDRLTAHGDHPFD